jgi:hypothetical protein
MKTIDNLTKDEKLLLLFAECACVDHGGIYQSERLNDDDRAILKKWQLEGFCEHGRVASEHLTPTRKVWLRLSDEAMRLAHELRMERATRIWGKRNWISTDEKRALPVG